MITIYTAEIKPSHYEMILEASTKKTVQNHPGCIIKYPVKRRETGID